MSWSLFLHSKIFWRTLGKGGPAGAEAGKETCGEAAERVYCKTNSFAGRQTADVKPICGEAVHMKEKEMARYMRHLVLFRDLREEPLAAALAALLEPGGAKDAEAAACDLAAELYPRGTDLRRKMLELVLESDNFLIRSAAAGQTPAPEALAWLENELMILEAACMSSAELAERFQLRGPLPSWTAAPLDFRGAYRRAMEEAPCRGWGIFARYHVFTLSEEGRLEPVEHPDPQRLSELYGYEAERAKLIQNTQALLQGLPANNALLYGDAGTGKSSTVKALANEYAGRGLRLIQVEKGRLHQIPALLDALSGNPLKFLLFIDDLSFASDDRDFTALKTVLEGSVAARGGNTVVYATSNRRHLVQETFQARQGDEVHLNDTLEEVASLSARFGIVITFGRPDRDLYLSVALHLARQMGLETPEEELIREAEAFALRAGGRSPRVARQYIAYKISIDTKLPCGK